MRNRPPPVIASERALPELNRPPALSSSSVAWVTSAAGITADATFPSSRVVAPVLAAA